MTTATNETCIGWLHENRYLMGEGITLLIAEDVNVLRGIFLMREMSKLWPAGPDFTPSPRFSIKV